MTFIELCRQEKLSRDDAEACARFLAFRRSGEFTEALMLSIRLEYTPTRKKSKVGQDCQGRESSYLYEAGI